MISSIITTAFSGMAAQQARLDAVAHNIANADTPDYARRSVEMVSGPGGGVRAVTREASAQGGVDLATELTDMIGAKTAYQANLAVMETGMDMWDALMSALEPKDRDERWR
ncbi:MAG: flagellar basal body protein [Hoeflea sp.]|uniref:flagellar basal body rod protein FlgC n=1 Tax=Hoeflea sp. TaxID=1940281 RepID=UPI001E0C4A41|nr:flagellar basal body protein [Hoeflea sp.]MBU4530955.1 flagellar basal body protein [Alphaproteobacteria bacterium]MBU4542730.1 flagellar basal body protein [Alphaproteobacteria bacterium]MBU4549343.1 flagellar basal body protein [Alphaproteobacteria bacterium]MBV1722847.1 flagellar basal body protein [Hoeflea sp.]MBV1761569.1 flagellar basal body protein [Hoeflea sp.]